MSAMRASYRARLRLEGGVLAGTGALGSALLLALVDAAAEHAVSTTIQLVVLAGVLAWFGPVLVRGWLAEAEPVAAEQPRGEATALWKPPLVVGALTALVVAPAELGIGGAGWDAGLRVTLGCVLVGLAQAVLLERIVAGDEARTARRYLRLPGSSAIGGTNLGFVRNEPA